MDEYCPLCFSPAHALNSRGRRAFFACPRCDLVFVPRSQHLSFEDARARYLLHENSLGHAGYVARIETLIALIKPFAPPPAVVLDYGCGPTPVLVELLRSHGYDARGGDPHFSDEQTGRETFDLVTTTETFEHFTRPAEDIENVMARLRPGGVLAVMTLLHGGAETIADWWYARDPTHVAFYSQKTFDFIAARHRLMLLHSNAKNTLIFRLC